MAARAALAANLHVASLSTEQVDHICQEAHENIILPLTANGGSVWLFETSQPKMEGEGFSTFGRDSCKVKQKDGHHYGMRVAKKDGWGIITVYESFNVEDCREVEKGTHRLLLDENLLEHQCLNIISGGSRMQYGKGVGVVKFGVYALFNRGGIAPLVLNTERMVRNIPPGIDVFRKALASSSMLILPEQIDPCSALVVAVDKFASPFPKQVVKRQTEECVHYSVKKRNGGFQSQYRYLQDESFKAL